MKIRFNLQAVLIIILIVFNLILAYLPLTNIIGYEFSALNGILLFLIFGLISIKKNFEIRNNNFLDFFVSIKNFSLLALLIPFLIGLGSTYLFSNCPFFYGVQFYLVITLPSAFFGSALGIYITSHISKFRYITFIIVFLIVLIYPLVEFYFNPQIYFYNIIFGFFPGTIYDEDLSVDNILISHRLLATAFFIGMLLLSNYVIKRELKKIKSFSIVIVVVSLFILLKPYLGYSTDLKRIQKTLNNKLVTEHFEIYFSDNIKEKKSLDILALLHEYYFESVQKYLDVRYKQKISSFIFDNENQKRILFGSGRADVAKPWLSQIYINYNNYQQSLKHEIAHVIASSFGTTPFHVADKINPALIEGLAMAVENEYDNYPLHYFAANGLIYQEKLEIKKIFEGFSFFSQSSVTSYLYAGSFIKYLADKYGIQKVKKLYGTLDFKLIFNKDVEVLQDEFYKYLRSLEIIYSKERAQLYFAGQPIFKKYCARVAASMTRKSWLLFYQNDFHSALKLFEDVYEYSNSYQSLIGKINCLIKLNKSSLADSVITKEINKFKGSPYFYNIELFAGDIKVRNGKINDANMLYDSLQSQNPNITYYNNVAVRKKLISSSTDSLKKFILGNEQIRYEMLLSMNKTEIFYESIPLLINYSLINNKAEDVLLNLSDKINITDYYSSYAVLILSKASISEKKLLLAQKLAIKALQFKDDLFFTDILVDNLRLVNWLINNEEETKKHFRYQ